MSRETSGACFYRPMIGEVSDVTGSMIRFNQPSFDWLSIVQYWLTSLFGGVSKGGLPVPLQTVEE